MAGAVNGHVRIAVHDPVPELHVGPMDLPDGERVLALEGLSAAMARRSPGRPALDEDMVAAIRAAYLRGWCDSRWHGMAVRAREARAEMDGGQLRLEHVVATVESRPAGPAVGRGR